ncbi:uncharacterized protein [Oryza sativa Japonica Group]|uniref:Expressed protein n=1 Tax=Oryza sativa subsp. japonica TaxID=39947 RepID=Q2QN76_ORYSJ|nr:uncharacterized protein LOC4352611 isoform X2 [Oryza sativa Japonica Group]ABA99008.2 expressed protein [Oryza sativa Japonica Group]KAF2908473.1 hypothetical protein DAI22_12g186800 [Oryza sativa Japonica Group]BAT17775.1 Os12g0576300 [Oryza sativa Japonica Group]
MDNKHHKNVEAGKSSFHRMVLGQLVGEFGFDEENVPCNTPRSSVRSRFGASASRIVASTSGASVSPGEYVRDPGSILSLQPWIFKRSGSQKNEEKMMLASGSRVVGEGKNLMDSFRDGSAVEVSPRSPGLGSGPGRGRGALRSRRSRRHLIRPLVPMENSYIPQLYSADFEIDECTFGPAPSPASARPFIVTDGRRVISKSRYQPVPVPFHIGFEKEGRRNSSEMVESVIGIAPLPELKKSKRERQGSHNGGMGLSAFESSKPSKSTDLLARLRIFSTGVSIGIISSTLSNKNELDALKGTVKRMENLIQDLHDELEMREGLTVKELPNEMSVKIDDDESKAHVTDSEPMSKIEEELEAELARLELNITSNCLKEQTFDFSEDLIGDIVQGELKIDTTHCDLADHSSESAHGRDSRESSPDYTHDANYPVSPRDLSLRLHKVIQQRLEERIKELETTLAQSEMQTQVQVMATEQILCERTCSDSDSGSPNQESPVYIQETNSLVEPFCLNLAGDALEAYDEAYEEFMRIADSPCTTSTNGKPQVHEDYSVDRSLIWGLEDGSARKLKKVPTWERILKSREPNRTQESDGDDEDEFEDDDQDSKMLIQQIIERTKQGSPVLIHAQRILFSVDD